MLGILEVLYGVVSKVSVNLTSKAIDKKLAGASSLEKAKVHILELYEAIKTLESASKEWLTAIQSLLDTKNYKGRDFDKAEVDALQKRLGENLKNATKKKSEALKFFCDKGFFDSNQLEIYTHEIWLSLQDFKRKRLIYRDMLNIISSDSRSIIRDFPAIKKWSFLRSKSEYFNKLQDILNRSKANHESLVYSKQRLREFIKENFEFKDMF